MSEQELKIALQSAQEEHSKALNEAPLGFTYDQLMEYLEPYDEKLTELSQEYRYIQTPVFSEIPAYAHVMSLKNFIENCDCGGFIDYDGFGRYVRDGKESDIKIYPSDVEYDSIRTDFDTVSWYNR